MSARRTPLRARLIVAAGWCLLLLAGVGAFHLYDVLREPDPRPREAAPGEPGARLQQFSSGLPSSRRSRTAVRRTAPVLRPALADKGLRLGQPVYLRLFKESRELELWMKAPGGWRRFKTYEICNYSGGLGPKIREGDGKSPEGFYRVTGRQLNPDSSYHLSFNLGFPNAWDRAKGRTGSFLMVHGDCVSIGCYAMTDAGIEEIWTLVTAALEAGQGAFQVHVFPFRMTETAMVTHRRHESAPFWRELLPCYRRFEETRRPPRVRVRNGRYRCS